MAKQYASTEDPPQKSIWTAFCLQPCLLPKKAYIGAMPMLMPAHDY